MTSRFFFHLVLRKFISFQVKLKECCVENVKNVSGNLPLSAAKQILSFLSLTFKLFLLPFRLRPIKYSALVLACCAKSITQFRPTNQIVVITMEWKLLFFRFTPFNNESNINFQSFMIIHYKCRALCEWRHRIQDEKSIKFSPTFSLLPVCDAGVKFFFIWPIFGLFRRYF